MVIPKPLCQCAVCKEARTKGAPFARTGPSVFIHDERLLIDTPAEIAYQLNRSNIESVDYLMFTHLDPDHVEGFRVVEQVAIDFRTWRAFPHKQIHLVLPHRLLDRLRGIHTAYGSQLDFYEESGFVRCTTFEKKADIGPLSITGIPIDRGDQVSFIYVFEKDGRKVVYAPCDIKPFPEQMEAVCKADLLIIQPGIFETGLRHGFQYPRDHVSRTTLYTFEETLALVSRIEAAEMIFVHLEEYWNKGYEEYGELEEQYENIRFAYDGMNIAV